MNRTRLFLSVAIILVTLLYWGFSGSPELISPKQAATLNDGADFYLKSPQLTQFDSEGALSQTVRSPYLIHHTNSKVSDLQAPTIEIYDAGENSLSISADKARILDGTQLTTLEGNVRLDNHSGPFQLLTDRLLIHPDNHTAETNLPVLISRGDSKITAVGLVANYRLGTLELLDQVQGYIDAQ